jgi:hypothetical protein
LEAADAAVHTDRRMYANFMFLLELLMLFMRQWWRRGRGRLRGGSDKYTCSMHECNHATGMKDHIILSLEKERMVKKGKNNFREAETWTKQFLREWKRRM